MHTVGSEGIVRLGGGRRNKEGGRGKGREDENGKGVGRRRGREGREGRGRETSG